jgi:hypothetical protein
VSTKLSLFLCLKWPQNMQILMLLPHHTPQAETELFNPVHSSEYERNELIQCKLS